MAHVVYPHEQTGTHPVDEIDKEFQHFLFSEAHDVTVANVGIPGDERTTQNNSRKRLRPD